MFGNELSNQVIIALRRIIRAIDIYSHRLVVDYNLTGPQLLILQSIIHRKQVSLGELARMASLSNATVTGIIDRLERRGLVERQRGSRDRRQVFVVATESAQQMLKNAPPLLQEKFIAEFNGLPERERRQILGSLDKIALMMGVEKLDASPFLASHPLQTSENALLEDPGDSQGEPVQ